MLGWKAIFLLTFYLLIFDDKFVFASEFIKQFFNEVRLRIGGQSPKLNYIALLHLPRTFVE